MSFTVGDVRKGNVDNQRNDGAAGLEFIPAERNIESIAGLLGKWPDDIQGLVLILKRRR